MNTLPKGVRQAVIGVWATLAISALSALAGKLSGLSSQRDFVLAVLTYALLCIFPYKLARRGNAVRHVYAVLIGISVLFMAAGVGALNKIDFAVSVLLIPVEAFIIYRLFQPEASAWYTSSESSKHD